VRVCHAAFFVLLTHLYTAEKKWCDMLAGQAPEIVNQEHYTQKADVFSFGIILWELLTRREPYTGITGMQLAYKVAKEGLRPPVPAYCPEEYAQLMTLSWDADPEKRPNFTDLVHSLLVRASRVFCCVATAFFSLLPPRTTRPPPFTCVPLLLFSFLFPSFLCLCFCLPFRFHSRCCKRR